MVLPRTGNWKEEVGVSGPARRAAAQIGPCHDRRNTLRGLQIDGISNRTAPSQFQGVDACNQCFRILVERRDLKLAKGRLLGTGNASATTLNPCCANVPRNDDQREPGCHVDFLCLCVFLHNSRELFVVPNAPASEFRPSRGQGSAGQEPLSPAHGHRLHARLRLGIGLPALSARQVTLQVLLFHHFISIKTPRAAPTAGRPSRHSQVARCTRHPASCRRPAKPNCSALRSWEDPATKRPQPSAPERASA